METYKRSVIIQVVVFFLTLESSLSKTITKIFKFQIRHPDTNHYIIVDRNSSEVRAASEDDFENLEKSGDFITWFITCSEKLSGSKTLDICLIEDHEKRIYYDNDKKIFTFMKVMESPPSNLWRQGDLKKQFVLNVKGHHLWSHLQVQGKNEEILDSLAPEAKNMFEKKASKTNSNDGTILRIEHLKSISKEDREKLSGI